MGLAGYYHWFVPNFTHLISPLTDITQKNAPDLVECQEMKTLCGESLLHMPNFSFPVVLHITGGWGQVSWVDRPLVPEKEKECLTIQWVVNYLCYYLLGHCILHRTKGAEQDLSLITQTNCIERGKQQQLGFCYTEAHLRNQFRQSMALLEEESG